MIDVFGWVAATIGIAMNIPQLVRILRVRTSAGVSLRLWQVQAATTASWMVHGFIVGKMQMQWPNMMMAAFGLLVVVFVLRDRRQAILPQLLLTAGAWALLVSVEVFLGSVVFGFVVAVPQVYGQAAQLREMVKAPDLSGVSSGFLAIMLLVQSMWFTFGVWTVDWSLIIAAGATAALALLNLLVYLVRWARSRSDITLAV